MSDEDPFAEPGDTDRTVIRPSPSGRRAGQAAAQAQTPVEGDGPAGPAAGESSGLPRQNTGIPPAQANAARADTPEARSIEQAVTGMNRLNACASTIFLLVSRIRNRAQHMDPGALRQSVVSEIRAFENRALQSGIPAQDVRVARYAICATLDDVVLNTPWGGTSAWTQQSMVGTFHKETVGGDRFYDLISRLEADPANNIDLLEFLYQCLALGFEGRLRVEPSGADKHAQIRAGLARIIRAQRGPVESNLSPHWKGKKVRHKPRSLLGLFWVVSGGLAAVLGVTFLTFWWLLGNQTERTLGQLSVLEPNEPATLGIRPPPPPAPLPPTGEEKLVKVTEFLQPEIQEELVEVFAEGNQLVVRMVGKGMFPSGSDSVKPEFVGAIQRVARSLNEERGRIIVVGHSDSIPVSSGRFASNMALSLARAEAVTALVRDQLADKSRVSAEGRGEREPIASNATQAGRAQNRRIEIVLVGASI